MRRSTCSAVNTHFSNLLSIFIFSFTYIIPAKKHSPTAMVRLCFALLLLRKEQDGIDMPRGLMDDLKGEVIVEDVHECALGNDILSADLGCRSKDLFFSLTASHICDIMVGTIHVYTPFACFTTVVCVFHDNRLCVSRQTFVCFATIVCVFLGNRLCVSRQSLAIDNHCNQPKRSKLWAFGQNCGAPSATDGATFMQKIPSP